MGSEPNDVDIERMWREQPRQEERMSLADVRARAAAHAKRTRKQDRLTYLVVGAVIVANIIEFTVEMSVFERIGAGLMLVALVLVLRHYGRARGSQAVPDELGLRQSVDFYRASLIRQRDLVRRFWLWGALPFVPGIAISMLGTSGQPLTSGRVASLVTVFAMLIAVIAWMNSREAARLQKEISALDG